MSFGILDILIVWTSYDNDVSMYILFKYMARYHLVVHAYYIAIQTWDLCMTSSYLACDDSVEHVKAMLLSLIRSWSWLHLSRFKDTRRVE